MTFLFSPALQEVERIEIGEESLTLQHTLERATIEGAADIVCAAVFRCAEEESEQMKMAEREV